MEKLDRELFFLTFLILLVFNVAVLKIPWVPSLILSFFLSLGIYAFKGFEMENLASVNTLFVNDFLGSLASGLAFLPLYPLFRPHLVKYDLIFSVLMSSITIPVISHVLFKRYLSRVPPKRYLVVGDEKKLRELAQEIEEKTFGKVLFADYMNPSPEKVIKKIETGNFDALLVADPEMGEKIEECLGEMDGVKIEHLPSVVERCIHRIPIEVIRDFSEYYKLFFESVKGDSPAKRILDIVVSLVSIVLFSPIMLLITIAVLLEDGPPVVFKQRRVGKNGEVFVLHKFRSMKETSKSTRFADEDRNRITRVGKLIRPYRLDELPQFFDVLSGRMSVVGPRPEQEESARIFEKVIPFYRYRYLVKPGLTGWAQINYKHSRSVDETKVKLSYDLWYVKNRNIFLDLRIILQTIETMLFKRGAGE